MRRWVLQLLAAPVILAVVVAAIGFGYPLLTGPWYRSEAVLVVHGAPQRPYFSSSLLIPTHPPRAEEIQRYTRQLADELQSEALFRRLVSNIRGTSWFQTCNHDSNVATDVLTEFLQVRVAPESTTIEVSLSLPDEPEAQEVLATLMKTKIYGEQTKSVDHRLGWSIVTRELERGERDYEALKQAKDAPEEELNLARSRINRATTRIAELQGPGDRFRIEQQTPATENQRVWWIWPF